MAVRFRKGRASPWQAYWNNPITGKRESKNFIDQKEAEKYDALIKYRIKYEKESFQKEETEQEQEAGGLTLQALYVEYLKRKHFDKRALTSVISNSRGILENLGTMDVREITKDMIKALIDKDLTTKVTATTVNRRFSILRAVLHFGVERGMIETVDFPRLPSFTCEKFVPPTAKELQALLEVSPEHIRRVIIIGSQCGVRIGRCELFGLTWQDVDFDRAVLCVHGSKKNQNAPWREIPLRQSLLDVLRVWHDSDSKTGIRHIIHYAGQPIGTIHLSWKAALKRAGITRRIRPYDLRHAFATEAIAGGADIGTVASLMGHANPSMILKHYQYVLTTQKRAAIEALPELNYVPTPMCPNAKPHDFSNNHRAL